MTTWKDEIGTTAYSRAFGLHFFTALNAVVEETEVDEAVTLLKFSDALDGVIGVCSDKSVVVELTRRMFVFFEVLEADGLIEEVSRPTRGYASSVNGVKAEAPILSFKPTAKLRERELLFRHPHSPLKSSTNSLMLDMTESIMDLHGTPIDRYVDWFNTVTGGGVSNVERWNIQNAHIDHGWLEQVGVPVRGKPRVQRTPISHSFRPVRSICRNANDPGWDVETDFVRFAFLPFRSIQLYYLIRHMMKRSDSYVAASDLNTAWQELTGVKKIDRYTRLALIDNALMKTRGSGHHREYRVSPERTAKIVRTNVRTGEVLDIDAIKRVCGRFRETEESLVIRSAESPPTKPTSQSASSKITYSIPGRAYTVLMLTFYLQSTGDDPISRRFNAAYKELTGLSKLHPEPDKILVNLGLMERKGPHGKMVRRVLFDPRTLSIKVMRSGAIGAFFTLEQIVSKFGPMPDEGTRETSILAGMPDVSDGLEEAMMSLFEWIAENRKSLNAADLAAVRKAVAEASAQISGRLGQIDSGLAALQQLRSE